MKNLKSKVVGSVKDNELKYVIENTDDSDYQKVHEYNRMDEVQEIVRGKEFLSLRDFPDVYKNKNGYFYFGTKKEMIPFYRAELKSNGKVILYELTLKAYNRLGF